MKEWYILGVLLWLTAEDIKEQMLSVKVIVFLGASGIFDTLYSGHMPAWQPGVLTLLAGKATKEGIGYGDGWLILSLGMWLTLKDLLFLLTVGMIFSVLYGVLSGKKEMPFVPFLTVGYLAEMLIR